jgi:hypothetical protein
MASRAVGLIRQCRRSWSVAAFPSFSAPLTTKTSALVSSGVLQCSPQQRHLPLRERMRNKEVAAALASVAVLLAQICDNLAVVARLQSAQAHAC